MFQSHFTIVLALILVPPNKADSLLEQESPYLQAFRPHMARLSVNLELMDRREYNYMFKDEKDLRTDLNILRARASMLAGAPFIRDSFRYPSPQHLNDMMSFNREFRRFLEGQFEFRLAPVYEWELREVIQEVDDLYQIYDAVRDSRLDYYYISVRRGSLQKLKKLLGDEPYASGWLPPHVPLWRFSQMGN